MYKEKQLQACQQIPPVNIQLLEKLDKLLNAHERRKRPDGVTEGASPRFRCSKCKKLGHFKRNNPLNKTPSTENNVKGRNVEGEANTKRVGRSCNKSSTRKKGRKARSSSAGLVEAGMYLPVQINGIEANMLIDSGATASLISVEVYERIDKKKRPSLNSV